MITEKIQIWNHNEYNYPMAMGFIPSLMTYLHEDMEIRPCLIIVPGGGYTVVSPTEGEIVAKRFYEMGYQTFVLTYTTNLLMSAPLKEQPMKDLSRAIRYVRKHAEDFRIASDRLSVCGFSAGGHLCASVCVHYEDIKETNEEFGNISNRPDAAVLSYPVITSGRFAHKDSFKALLGMGINSETMETECTGSEEEMEYMSLEKQVHSNMPPCFLWQTADDELVPIENSALFAQACKDNNVPFAYHVFTHGCHGLSLADDVWASGQYGDIYTMEQTFAILNSVKSGAIPVPQKEKEELFRIFHVDTNEQMAEQSANSEVAIWPQLADQWLRLQLV